MMEFARGQRLPVPSVSAGQIAVKAPPAMPKPAPGNPVARLLPAVMLVACIGMTALYFTSGAASHRSPMFMFFPVMMAMSVLGSVVYGARGGAARSAEIDTNRRAYLRYLDSLDESLADAVAAQRRSQYWSHPDPATLWTLVGGRRMWERDQGDADFLRVRIGIGAQDLCTPLTASDGESDENTDPVTTSAMRALVSHRSLVDEMPLSVALAGTRVLAMDGDREHALAMVRAMICQLAVWHGPDRVHIAAVVGDGQRSEWDWLKWLPHHQHTGRVDALGPARLVFDTLEAAAPALETPSAHAVIVVDGVVARDDTDARLSGAVTVIDVASVSTDATRMRFFFSCDGSTVRDDTGRWPVDPTR